jgi:hypothetical protein
VPSRYGLTVDEALARVMVAECIPDEAERRREIREILHEVRSLAYHEGSEEERCQGSWS